VSVWTFNYPTLYNYDVVRAEIVLPTYFVVKIVVICHCIFNVVVVISRRKRQDYSAAKECSSWLWSTLSKFQWGKMGKKLGQSWFQISIRCCCFRVEFQERNKSIKDDATSPIMRLVDLLLMLFFCFWGFLLRCWFFSSVGMLVNLRCCFFIWGYVFFFFFCSEPDQGGAGP